MYYVKKRMIVAGSHRLNLPYESKCSNLHGHNWEITVECKSKELTDFGMVMDFKHIKNEIEDRLDHRNLNDIVPFNPTAENLAKWICDLIPNCYRVTVVESEDNVAVYEKEEC